MIFVGKRQCGKTHNMIQEVLKRYEIGDTIGVIGYNKNHAIFLKEKIAKELGDDYSSIKIISLNEIDSVDHVVIDELDLVLGEKCVCSSGGVVNIVRKDEKYNEYEKSITFDNYTYQENEIESYKRQYDSDEIEAIKEFNRIKSAFANIGMCIEIEDDCVYSSLMWARMSVVEIMEYLSGEISECENRLDSADPTLVLSIYCQKAMYEKQYEILKSLNIM